MFKHYRSTAWVQSALFFAMVAMISAAAPAQKGPSSTTGAPLKGVDVKLGKNPGGSPAGRAVTNAKGEFNFGVVPAGKYDLIVSPPPDSADTQAGGGAGQRTSNLNLSKSNINRLAITIDGVKGGPIKKNLDFKPKEPDATQRAGKPKYEDITVTIDTDGKSEVKGTITARAVNNPGVK